MVRSEFLPLAEVTIPTERNRGSALPLNVTAVNHALNDDELEATATVAGDFDERWLDEVDHISIP